MNTAHLEDHLYMGSAPVPVTLKPLSVPLERKVFQVRHAAVRGIRWAVPGVPPRELADVLLADAPLPPWAVVALLVFGGRKTKLPPGRAEVLLASIDRDLDAEQAVAALEKEAGLRGLRGGAIVRPLASSTIRPAPSRDVGLCLLVLAKSAERVFVASKRPVLERLHPRSALEFLQPVTGQAPGGEK